MANSILDDYVDAASTKLHYYECGDGEPLILLHDFGGGSNGLTFWRKNIEPLAETFRVIAFDLPGYGASEAVVLEEPRFDFSVRAIKDALEELNIESAHLVGNGPGAGIALLLASKHPDKVRSLVVCGAAGVGQPLFSAGPSDGALASLASTFDPTSENIRKHLSYTVVNQKLITDEVVNERVAEAAAHPEHIEAYKKTSFWYHIPRDILPQMEQIKCPTLAIWGREDKMGHLDAGLRIIRYIANSWLIVFPNCGNMAHFEKPDAFNRSVKDFISYQ